MKNDIEKIILSEGNIADITEELSENINKDYKDKNLVVVCVLKGSFMFASDLLKLITIPCEVEFIQTNSDNGTKLTGEVAVINDLKYPVTNKDVLIVEDIIDSGVTLNCIVNHIKSMSPSSIKICTLIDKKESRKVEISADYIGETIENGFVVGYGLDCNEKYRNLPYIGILKKECM